jgi:uncharacterized protein YggT (Ycf19 family)
MSDRDEHEGPELVTYETIELLLRGAKAMVIVVYAVVIVTFAILTLGFFLHLAGASAEAPFVEWAYRNTDRAMQPFRGMFPVQDIDNRSVFDASLLFAAAFYGFVAIGLHALVVYLTAKARGYHLRAVADARAAAEEEQARQEQASQEEEQARQEQARREQARQEQAPTPVAASEGGRSPVSEPMMGGDSETRGTAP